MKIYFKNVGGRLPGVTYPESSKTRTITEPWFWVVHPTRSAKDFFEDAEYGKDAKYCLEQGGAILFIKGTRYAGMGSEEEAQKLEDEHKNRIHCLRVACSSNSPKVVERVRRFLEKIEKLDPQKDIPWEKVEPAAWPESLVAIYLVLKAIEQSPKDADKIRQAWGNIDSKWRQQLWSEAWGEYCKERGLSESAWVEAHLPSPNSPQVDLPERALIPKAIEAIRLGLSDKH